MKILFVGGIDLTIHPNHRAHHFIAYLERNGIQLDVISMIPFYTGNKPTNSWNRFWAGIRESLRNPVVINHRKTGIEVAIRRLPSRLDAFLHSLWAYFHLSPLRGKHYDVCIFGNPDNVLLPLILKKRGIVKSVIYDDWDFYPGFNRSWFFNNLTRFREHLCISNADVVISVGSLLSELRKSQGAARTLIIPNGVNYPLFAKAQQKRPHPPTLIYTGRLDKDWGVDISIEGFALVHNKIPDARYLIIGYNEGDYVNYLHDLVDRLELNECITFVGPKRYEELPHYLAEADIGVALHRPNELMKYAFPLKVIEYMAASLAIIGILVGETEKVILDSECGKCIPYSSEAFGNAVLDILSNNSTLSSYREHAKYYAKRYDWDTLFSNVLDVINSSVHVSEKEQI